MKKFIFCYNVLLFSMQHHTYLIEKYHNNIVLVNKQNANESGIPHIPGVEKVRIINNILILDSDKSFTLVALR